MPFSHLTVVPGLPSDEATPASYDLHLSNDVFFRDRVREYELVLAFSTQEWLQYGPSTSIFSNFINTLQFKDVDSHVAYFPQPVYKANMKDKADLGQNKDRVPFRIPDGAGIIVSKQPTVAPASTPINMSLKLCWWSEEKTLLVSDYLEKVVEYNVVVGWVLGRVLEQVNDQAKFAFSRYATPQNKGFYTFLIAGDTFTLFFYHQPRITGEEPSNMDPIVPDVVMLHEQIFNDDRTQFSDQMLYAFELLREAIRSIQPLHVEPSFFHPRMSVQVGNMKLNDTTVLANALIELADKPRRLAEELTSVLQETIPSPPHDTRNDPSYRGRPPTYTTSPRETRSRSRASQSSEGQDAGNNNGSDIEATPQASTRADVPNATPGPSRTQTQYAEPESPTPRGKQGDVRPEPLFNHHSDSESDSEDDEAFTSAMTQMRLGRQSY
ncbi:hypothetical protein BDW22DRAFT_1449146 [Trametopsis cervina]|nr:hypothetical protein BDW22DRAFT_1449146 [Trametopsis cervina]